MKVFTLGWLSVFMGIFFMNFYIWDWYRKIPFQNARIAKISSYGLIHLLLIFISIYYFYLFFTGQTDKDKDYLLSKLSAFYISFLHYSFIMYLIHDLVYLTSNIVAYPKILRNLGGNLFFGGFLIFALAALISIYSLYNAKDLVIKRYDLDLEARSSSLEDLNIVYISDGHFGSSLNRDNIDDLIEEIDGLKPDILFLGGDFFDEGTRIEDKKLFAKKIASIETSYGIFAVEGNHEYKSGQGLIDQEMAYLSRESIRVLQDEIFNLEDDLIIIGRKDKYGKNKELKDILGDKKYDLPYIVLDHRPNFRESEKIEEIDLQISGHTHGGQFFPMVLLDKLSSSLIKENIYGYYEIGDKKYIVSSGVGDWAISSRFASKREIVNIKINFKK